VAGLKNKLVSAVSILAGLYPKEPRYKIGDDDEEEEDDDEEEEEEEEKICSGTAEDEEDEDENNAETESDKAIPDLMFSSLVCSGVARINIVLGKK